MKIADFVGTFLGVPDVRTYLSGIWGLILMLLNIFHPLSNGYAPLVDDLGPSAFPRKWAHLRKLAAQYSILLIWKIRSEVWYAFCEPLLVFQSSLGSKAASFAKIEYLRTPGTKCRTLKQIIFFGFFTKFWKLPISWGSFWVCLISAHTYRGFGGLFWCYLTSSTT